VQQTILLDHFGEREQGRRLDCERAVVSPDCNCEKTALRYQELPLEAGYAEISSRRTGSVGALGGHLL
jgi:hypothetical protein